MHPGCYLVVSQALLQTPQGTKFNYGQQYVLVPVPQSHQEQQVNSIRSPETTLYQQNSFEFLLNPIELSTQRGVVLKQQYHLVATSNACHISSLYPLCLFVQKLLPNITGTPMYPENSSEWIRFTLQHPTHHPHDFSTSRCVTVILQWQICMNSYNYTCIEVWYTLIQQYTLNSSCFLVICTQHINTSCLQAPSLAISITSGGFSPLMV